MRASPQRKTFGHTFCTNIDLAICLQLEAGSTEPIHFQHAMAEATNLPDASQNLVSACLLFHELPQSAAQNIVREAFRVLRPGGVLSIMVSPAVNVDVSCSRVLICLIQLVQ